MAERPMAEGVIRFTPDKRSLKQVERQVGKTVGKIEQVASRGGLLGKSYTQPLGKITGAVGEFEKSLEASHARVVAFGASAGIIFAVTNAIQSMTRATIELEHRLAEINVILAASGSSLKGFGEELFNVAKNTGQTFDAVSEAALEFARQGLAIEETLKRTRDAMILTRLSGLDVKSSVESITATMNSFNQTVITSTTLINKLANVDAAFAVSSADLAHAIRRVGSSAQDAGLGIDELIAMVTTAQQVTARGGAVIGNSLKTIFTRLQRPQVLQDLAAFGVVIKSTEGAALPAIAVLKNFADTYQTLTGPQKAVAAEMVGGVFQVNVLKAAIGDLGKQFSIYDRALGTSIGSTDQAIARNEALNKTLKTLINESLVNLQKVGAAFAEVTISPAITSVLETLNSGLEKMSEKAESDSIGVKMGKGIMQGIGSVLKGPGLILLAGILSKLTYNFFQFSTDALRTFSGLNQESKTQAEMQQLIQNLLLKNPDLIGAAMHSAEGLALVEREILNVVQSRNIALEQSIILSNKMSQGLTSGDLASLNKSMEAMGGGGRTAGAWRPAAAGFIPSFSRKDEAAEAMGAINAGYEPGKIKRMNVAGFGQVTYNDNEKIKQFPGMEQPAIMPPSTSDAGHAYKQKFKDRHGFDPYSFGGYVPNFAPKKSTHQGPGVAKEKRKALWMQRLGKLERHKAEGKMESGTSMSDIARLLGFKGGADLRQHVPAVLTAKNRTRSTVLSTMGAFGYDKKTRKWPNESGRQNYLRMRSLIGEVEGNLMGTNYITGLGNYFEKEFADIMATNRTGGGSPIDFVSLPARGKSGMPREAIKMMPKYTKGDTIWGQTGHGEIYMASKILAEKGITKDFSKEMRKYPQNRTFDFGSSRVVEILGAKDREHFAGFRRKNMSTTGAKIASNRRAYGPLRELAEDGNEAATFRLAYRQDSVHVGGVEEKWKKKWAGRKTAAEGLVPNLTTRILDRDYLSMVMGTTGRTKGLNEVWNEIVKKAAGSGKLSELITGTPGIGKTTLAVQKAGGRNFIGSPEELLPGDDLIVLRALTTNVGTDEFRHAKKITHLKAEKDVVMAMREKRKKEGKEGTSQTLFGRDPGGTMGAEVTGVTTEAMLGETYPKKLTVLARQADMSLKELENAAGITTLDDVSVTMGAFSPFTKGHQEMIQGGSGKTRVAFVSKGVDREGDIGLSISEKIKLMELADPQLMGVSGAAGVQQIFEHKGQAYRLGKKREITLGSDRVFGTKAETQKFRKDREAFYAANGPRAKKSDSPAIAKKRMHFKDAMKDDVAQGFYTQGFDVTAVPRDPQGVSATKVRNAVLAGNVMKLKEYLPEATLPVIKKNLPKLQERARLIQQRKDNSQKILNELEIEKQAFDAEYGARKKKSEAAPVTDERKQLAARMAMYRKRLKSAGNSKIWAKLGLGLQFAEGLVPNLAYKGLHKKDLGQTLIPANPKDKVMTNVTEKQIQDKIAQQILIRGPQDESLIVGTDFEGRTNRMVIGGMNARKIKKGNSKYKLLLDQVPDLFDGVAYELASVIGAKFDAEGATDAVAGRQLEKEFEAAHGLKPAGAKAGSDYKVAEQIAQQLGTHKNLQLKLSTFERSKRGKNKIVNIASSFSKYLVDILTNNIKNYGLSSVTTPDKFQRAMQTLEANPALKEDWMGYMGQAGFMADGLIPNFKNTKKKSKTQHKVSRGQGGQKIFTTPPKKRRRSFEGMVPNFAVYDWDDTIVNYPRGLSGMPPINTGFLSPTGLGLQASGELFDVLTARGTQAIPEITQFALQHQLKVGKVQAVGDAKWKPGQRAADKRKQLEKYPKGTKFVDDDPENIKSGFLAGMDVRQVGDPHGPSWKREGKWRKEARGHASGLIPNFALLRKPAAAGGGVVKRGPGVSSAPPLTGRMAMGGDGNDFVYHTTIGGDRFTEIEGEIIPDSHYPGMEAIEISDTAHANKKYKGHPNKYGTQAYNSLFNWAKTQGMYSVYSGGSVSGAARRVYMSLAKQKGLNVYTSPSATERMGRHVKDREGNMIQGLATGTGADPKFGDAAMRVGLEESHGDWLGAMSRGHIPNFKNTKKKSTTSAKVSRGQGGQKVFTSPYKKRKRSFEGMIPNFAMSMPRGVGGLRRALRPGAQKEIDINSIAELRGRGVSLSQARQINDKQNRIAGNKIGGGSGEMDFDVTEEEAALVTHKNTRFDRVLSFLEAMRMVDPAFDRSDVFKRVGFNSNDKAFEEAFGGDKLQFFFATPPSDKLDETMNELAGKNAHEITKHERTGAEHMRADLGFGGKKGKERDYETGAAGHVGHYGTAASAFSNPADEKTGALTSASAVSEKDEWEDQQWERAEKQASGSVVRARNIIRAGMVARGLRFQDVDEQGRRAQGGIATKQMGEDYEAGQYFARSDKVKDTLGRGQEIEKVDWYSQEEARIRELPMGTRLEEDDKLKTGRRAVWKERLTESVDAPLVGELASESVTKGEFNERMNLAANQVIAQRLESSMGTRSMPTQYVAGYRKEILDKVLAARKETGGRAAGMEIMTQGVTGNDIDSIVPYIKMKAQKKVEGNKAVMGYLRRQANALRAGFEDYHALMSQEAALEAATRQEAAKKGQKGHVQQERGKSEFNIKDGKVVHERVDSQGDKVMDRQTVTVGTEKKFLKDAEGFRTGVSYEVGHELRGIEGAQRPPATIPEPHIVEAALKWQTGGWDAHDLEYMTTRNFKGVQDPRLIGGHSLESTHKTLSAFHREAKGLGFKDIDGSPLWDDFWAKQPNPVGFSNIPADVFDPSGAREALRMQGLSSLPSLPSSKELKAAYEGSVPNFSRDALASAVKREKDAGYSSGQVKVGFDSRLRDSGGVGVYNATEGSLSRAINMHLSSGKRISQIQQQGAFSGKVPNFQMDSMEAGMMAAGIGIVTMQIKELSGGVKELTGGSDAFKAGLKKAQKALAESVEAEGKTRSEAVKAHKENITALQKSTEAYTKTQDLLQKRDQAKADVTALQDKQGDYQAKGADAFGKQREMLHSMQPENMNAAQAAMVQEEAESNLREQAGQGFDRQAQARADASGGEMDFDMAKMAMGGEAAREADIASSTSAGAVAGEADQIMHEMEADIKDKYGQQMKLYDKKIVALQKQIDAAEGTADAAQRGLDSAEDSAEVQKEKLASDSKSAEKSRKTAKILTSAEADVKKAKKGRFEGFWSSAETKKEKGIKGAISRARGKGGGLDMFLKGKGAGLAFAAPMIASQATSMLGMKGGMKAGVESAGQGIGTAVAMGTMLGPVGLIGGLVMGANNLGKTLAKAKIKEKLEGVSKEFDLISDKLGKVTSGGQAYMDSVDKLFAAMSDTTGKVQAQDIADIKTKMAKSLGDVPKEFQAKFRAAAGDAEKIKKVFSEITEELTTVKNDLQAAKTGYEMQEKFGAGGGFFNVDETLFERNDKGSLTTEGKRLSAAADAQVALAANRAKLVEGIKSGKVSSKNFSLQSGQGTEMFGAQFQTFVEGLKDPKDIAEFNKKIKNFLGRMEEGIKVTDEAEIALRKKIATDKAYNRVLKRLSADVAVFGTTIGKITARITQRIEVLGKMSDRVKEFSLNMALAGQKGANTLGEPFRHKKDKQASDLSVKIAEINKKTITDSRKILGESAKANLDAVIGQFVKISGTIEKQASDISGKQNRELLTALERNAQAQQAMVPIVEAALMAQAVDPGDPEALTPIIARMASVLEQHGIDGQRAEANRDLLLEVTKGNGATAQNKLAELIQTQQHQVEIAKEQAYWAERSTDLQERIASFGGIGQYMSGTGSESKGITDLGAVLDEMILGSVSTSIEGMGRANLKLLDTLINKMNFDEMSKNIKALAPLLSTAIAARASDIQNQVGAATRLTRILDPSLAGTIPEVDAEQLATEQVASQLKLDQMPDDVSAIKENTALTNLLLQHQAEDITSKNKESFSEALRMNGIPQNMMQSAIAGNLTADRTKALGATNAAGFNLMLGPSREIQQTLSTIQSNLPHDLITAQTPVLTQISENLSNALVNKLSNFQSEVVVKDFSKVVEQREKALSNLRALAEARKLADAVAQTRANYEATEATRLKQKALQEKGQEMVDKGFPIELRSGKEVGVPRYLPATKDHFAWNEQGTGLMSNPDYAEQVIAAGGNPLAQTSEGKFGSQDFAPQFTAFTTMLNQIVGLGGNFQNFPDRQSYIMPTMYSQGRGGTPTSPKGGGWDDSGEWQATGENITAMLASMTAFWAEGDTKSAGPASTNLTRRRDHESGKTRTLAEMYEVFEQNVMAGSGFGRKTTRGLGDFNVKGAAGRMGSRADKKMPLNDAIREVFFHWAKANANAEFGDDEAAAMRKEVNALLREAHQRRTDAKKDLLGSSKEQYKAMLDAEGALATAQARLEKAGLIFETQTIDLTPDTARTEAGRKAAGDAAHEKQTVSFLAPRFESPDDKITTELIVEITKGQKDLLDSIAAAEEAVLAAKDKGLQKELDARDALAKELKRAADIAADAGLAFNAGAKAFVRPAAKGQTRVVKSAAQIASDQKLLDDARKAQNKVNALKALQKDPPKPLGKAEFEAPGEGRTGITAPRGAQVHAIQKGISELIHGHIKSYKEALDKGAASGGMEFTDLKSRLGSAKKESSVMGQLASLEKEKAGVMAEIGGYSSRIYDQLDEEEKYELETLRIKKEGLEAKQRALKSEEAALNFVIEHGSAEAKRQALLKKLNLKNIDINYVISRNLKQTGRLEKLLEEYGDMQAKLASGRMSKAIANALKSTKDMGGSKEIVDKGMAEFQQAIMGSIGFDDLKEKVGRGRASTLQSQIRDKQELFIRNQAQGIMDGLDKLSGDKKVVSLLKQRKLDITDMMRHEVEDWALANQGELVNILKDANFDSGKIEALRKGIYFMDEITARQIVLSHTMKESNMVYDHMLDLFDKGGATFEDLTSAFEEMKKASKAQGRLIDERKIREQLRRTAQNTADEFGQTLNEAFNGLARSSDMQNAMDTALKELIENPQAFKAQIKDLLPTDQSELIKGQYDKAGKPATPIDGAQLFQKLQLMLKELQNIDGRLHGSPSVATIALNSLRVLHNVRRASSAVAGSQKRANVLLGGIQRELAKSPLERLLSSSLGDIAKAIKDKKSETPPEKPTDKTPEEGDPEYRSWEKDPKPDIPPAITATSLTDNLADYLRSVKKDDKEGIDALIKAIEKMTPEQAHMALNPRSEEKDKNLDSFREDMSDAQLDIFGKLVAKSMQRPKKNEHPRREPPTVVRSDGGGAAGQGAAGGAGDLARKAEDKAILQTGLSLIKFGSQVETVSGTLGWFIKGIGKMVAGEALQKIREKKESASRAQLKKDNDAALFESSGDKRNRKLMDMRIPLATDQKTSVQRQVDDLVRMAKMNARGTTMKESFRLRKERFEAQLNDPGRTKDEKDAINSRLTDLKEKEEKSIAATKGQAIHNLIARGEMSPTQKEAEAAKAGASRELERERAADRKDKRAKKRSGDFSPEQLEDLFPKKTKGERQQELEDRTGQKLVPLNAAKIRKEQEKIHGAQQLGGKLNEMKQMQDVIDALGDIDASAMLVISPEEIDARIEATRTAMHKIGEIVPQEQTVKLIQHKMARVRKGLELAIEELGLGIGDEAKVTGARDTIQQDFLKRYGRDGQKFTRTGADGKEVPLSKEEALKHVAAKIKTADVKLANDYNLSFEAQHALFKEGVGTTEEMTSALSKYIEQTIRAGTYSGEEFVKSFRAGFTFTAKDLDARFADFAANFGKDFKSEISSAFSAAIKGTKDFKEAMSEAFGNLADKILDRSIETAVDAGLKFIGLNEGGLVRGYSKGGAVVGGSGVKDDIPAYLSKGEYVIKQAAVRNYGKDFFDSLNNASVVMAAKGGPAGGKAAHTKVIQNLSEQETKARNLRKNMSEAGLVPYGYKVKSERKKKDWLGRETGEYETDKKVGYRLDLSKPLTPERLEKIKKLAKSNAEIAKHIDQDIFSRSVYEVNEKGAKIQLDNKFVYDDIKRPESGKWMTDARLSSLALTDENNPQNKYKFEKSEAFFGYQKDKMDFLRDQAEQLEKYESGKKNRRKEWLFGAGAMLFTGAVMGKFARGGRASDDIPALLTGGEYVVRKGMVDKYGLQFFENLNRGQINTFNRGGYVTPGSITDRTGTDMEALGGFGNEGMAGAYGETNNNISIVVNIDKNGGVTTKQGDGEGTSSATTTEDGRKLGERVKAAVIDVIIQQKRPGGMLYD